MIDHTRTEKIGDDSIYICGHPSRAENRYDTKIKSFPITRYVNFKEDRFRIYHYAN